jgi:predicted dehydrogenase
VVSARAVLTAPDVDRTMEAELRFPSGVTARVRSALLSRQLFRSTVRLIGSAGSALVLNPYHPSFGNLVLVKGRRGQRLEVIRGDNVYRAQLRSFAGVIAGTAANRSDPRDALGTMRVLDAIYHAAGLRPRQGMSSR